MREAVVERRREKSREPDKDGRIAKIGEISVDRPTDAGDQGQHTEVQQHIQFNKD